MAQVNLQPLSPALGVNLSYCTPKQTVLCITEKVSSLRGDTLHILDENNREVVQWKNHEFSLSGRKEFLDSTGRLLFSLRTKLMSMPKSFYAEAPGGEILFEVKGKLTIGNPKMVATFVNTSNRANIQLDIKGDWLDRSATIAIGNQVVAQAARSYFNKSEDSKGQPSYFLTVAPNVDLVMMAAICVCLDDRHYDML